MEAKDMNRTECLHLEVLCLQFLFTLMVETVSPRAVLEFTMWLRLASNTRSLCLSLLSAVVTDVSHHTWQNTCLI